MLLLSFSHFWILQPPNHKTQDRELVKVFEMHLKFTTSIKSVSLSKSFYWALTNPNYLYPLLLSKLAQFSIIFSVTLTLVKFCEVKFQECFVPKTTEFFTCKRDGPV